MRPSVNPQHAVLVGQQAKILKMLLRLQIAYIRWRVRHLPEDYSTLSKTLDSAEGLLTGSVREVQEGPTE